MCRLCYVQDHHLRKVTINAPCTTPGYNLICSEPLPFNSRCSTSMRILKDGLNQTKVTVSAGVWEARVQLLPMFSMLARHINMGHFCQLFNPQRSNAEVKQESINHIGDLGKGLKCFLTVRYHVTPQNNLSLAGQLTSNAKLASTTEFHSL